MQCHELYQLTGRFLPGEALLLGDLVCPSEDLDGFDSQYLDDVLKFLFRKRLFGVFTVSVINPVFFQQGDRLATGASGFAADELQHFCPPMAD